MVTSTRRETSYRYLKPIKHIPSDLEIPAHGIFASQHDTTVDLVMLDGTMVKDLKLTRGVIYPIEFLQVRKISPPLQGSELWACFLPSIKEIGPYA